MGQSLEEELVEQTRETSYREGFRNGFRRAYNDYVQSRNRGLTEEETLKVISSLYCKEISEWASEKWINLRYSDKGLPHP